MIADALVEVAAQLVARAMTSALLVLIVAVALGLA